MFKVHYELWVSLSTEGDDEVAIKINATRYRDGTIVRAATVKAAMKLAAAWIENH